MSEVEYLGHVVSGQGVTMDQHKVQAVIDWPIPTNVKQLRGFLGLTGYYRRFIKSYATIASPLTDLLKKDNFQWSHSAELAFLTLKKAITSAPVLVLPDFSQPFILETDASSIGIGAMLSQQGHPIAYFSKKLGPNVQKQSAYVREFKALYGRDPPSLTRAAGMLEGVDEAVTAQLLNRDKILSQLQQNLNKAQVVMKNQADKKRTPLNLSVGELVVVKLQPYRQITVGARVNQKLSLKYFGPFEILAKIGSVAYKLALPSSARIHPVFHISQLKKFNGTESVHHSPLPPTTDELGPLLLPEAVLKTRTILKGPLTVPQVLIKWHNLDASLATWEDKADMMCGFPNFNLEDKVNANGGSIVRNVDDVAMTINDEPMIHDDEACIGSNSGHVVMQPQSVGVRRSNRERKANPKYK
ncbi:hypothetical protein A2U01_0001089 [Trifolium medium]|uniref:Uncharacterized protein n=1 Tax=Trifolium medium TaxID=97028 RepID=A0A392LZ64_9FABA|nr:hypothetical protein [Trifolium medium]